MPDPADPISDDILRALLGGQALPEEEAVESDPRRRPPPVPAGLRPAPTAEFPRFDFPEADPELTRRFITPITNVEPSLTQPTRVSGGGFRIPQFTSFVEGLAGSLRRGIENIGSLAVPGEGDFLLPGTQRRIDEIIERMGFDPDRLRANPDTLSGTFQTPSGLTFTKRTGREVMEIAERELRRVHAPKGAAEITGEIVGGIATFGAGEEGRSAAEISRGTDLERFVDSIIGGTVPAIGAGVAPLAGALTRRTTQGVTQAVASRIPQSQRAQIAQVARQDIPEFPAVERPVGELALPEFAQPATREAAALTEGVAPAVRQRGLRGGQEPSGTRLPPAVAGTPEAGVQQGSLGVPARPVTPRGAPAVQAGLDDQLRLEQLRAAARPREPIVDPLTTFEQQAEVLQSELFEIEGAIEALSQSGVVRPKWAVGLSNQELEAVARQEGLNPYLPDWADGIDSLVIREAKQGQYKGLADNLTVLRNRRTAVQSQLSGVDDEIDAFIQSELGQADAGLETALVRPDRELARRERMRFNQEGFIGDTENIPRMLESGGPVQPTPPTGGLAGAPPRQPPTGRPPGGAVDAFTGPGSESGLRPMNSAFFDRLLTAHVERPEARDLLRAVAERAEDKRFWGPLVRSTNPSATASVNPVRAEGYAYRLAEQVQDSQLSFRMSRFARNVPFDIDDQGRILLQDGKRVAFGDVAENPSKFALRPEEREWIDQGRLYLEKLAQNYENVSGKQIRRFLQREQYWPRFVRQDGGGVGVRSRVGAKQSSVRQRIFESMEDGLEEGVSYETNPLRQLELYGRAIQKLIRDEVLLQRLKEKGFTRPLSQGRLRRGEVTSEDFGFRGFQTQVFDRETARILRGPLESGRGFLRPIEMVSAVPRLLVTGIMDTGQFMIQGITLLARTPEGWARSLGVSLRSMADPRFYSRYVANSAQARRAVDAGVDPGMTSEFFQAMSIIGRVPVVGPVSRVVQRGFESFLGAGRISIFDAMADAAALPARTGIARPLNLVFPRGNLSGATLESEMFRVAHIADTLMGTPSTRSLGVSATQRQVENAFLAFSPRYTRSVFGTIGYMFGKGFGPQEVRAVVGKMLFGGAATFYGLAQAAGMSHDEIVRGLNPMSGARFMSIRIGGAWFGLGGAYRSLLAFAGSLADKERWDFDNWGDAVIRNPIVSYLRSRTSPLTGSVVDAIEGQDFIGRPFSLEAFAENPKLLLDYLVSKGAPFPVQAFIDLQGTVPERLVGVAAESQGLRTSPARLLDVRNAASQERFGLDYDDPKMGPQERDEINAVASVESAVARSRTRGLARGDEITVYLEGRQDAVDNFNRKVGAVAEKLGPGKEFRVRLGKLQIGRAERLDQLEIDNPKAIERLADTDPREHGLDRAMRAYFDALEEAKLEDPDTGDFDFEKRRVVLQSLREQWGEDVIDEVETFIRRNDHPLVAQLKLSREILKPYWGLREVMAELLDAAKAFQEWSALSGGARQDFLDLERNARLKEAFRQADAMKVRLRQTNSEIDRHLLAWGYVTKARHPELKAETEILRRIGGGVLEDRSPLLPQVSQREPEEAVR